MTETKFFAWIFTKQFAWFWYPPRVHTEKFTPPKRSMDEAWFFDLFTQCSFMNKNGVRCDWHFWNWPVPRGREDWKPMSPKCTYLGFPSLPNWKRHNLGFSLPSEMAISMSDSSALRYLVTLRTEEEPSYRLYGISEACKSHRSSLTNLLLSMIKLVFGCWRGVIASATPIWIKQFDF